jgi:hypothetical protein
MLTDLLIVALAASFIVSFLDRWFDSGLYRGITALIVSAGGVLVFEYTGWIVGVLALAAAFASLLMVLVGERLATPPPMVLDPRRR